MQLILKIISFLSLHLISCNAPMLPEDGSNAPRGSLFDLIY